jgi:hypothetical protein
MAQDESSAFLSIRLKSLRSFSVFMLFAASLAKANSSFGARWIWVCCSIELGISQIAAHTSAAIDYMLAAD